MSFTILVKKIGFFNILYVGKQAFFNIYMQVNNFKKIKYIIYIQKENRTECF